MISLVDRASPSNVNWKRTTRLQGVVEKKKKKKIRRSSSTDNAQFATKETRRARGVSTLKYVYTRTTREAHDGRKENEQEIRRCAIRNVAI